MQLTTVPPMGRSTGKSGAHRVKFRWKCPRSGPSGMRTSVRTARGCVMALVRRFGGLPCAVGQARAMLPFRLDRLHSPPGNDGWPGVALGRSLERTAQNGDLLIAPSAHTAAAAGSGHLIAGQGG